MNTVYENTGFDEGGLYGIRAQRQHDAVKSPSAFATQLVHQVRDWFSGVAIKMGRRQGATKEHI